MIADELGDVYLSGSVLENITDDEFLNHLSLAEKMWSISDDNGTTDTILAVLGENSDGYMHLFIRGEFVEGLMPSQSHPIRIYGGATVLTASFDMAGNLYVAGNLHKYSDACSSQRPAPPPTSVLVQQGVGPGIQYAIDIAAENATITVNPGVYSENIDFKGKNIVLQSSNPNDESVVASTIIHGAGAGPVVRFSGIEDETCILQGFTIRNGNGSSGVTGMIGGGISGDGTDNVTGVPIYTHATIRNNVIESNSGSRGGGIYGCDGMIENNTVQSNSASHGGGVSNCHGVIRGNLIDGNTAQYSGGGLEGCSGPGCIIESNIITNNTASVDGGGVYGCFGISSSMESYSAPIINNIIAWNTAGNIGGGIAHSTGRIQNNTIYGNNASGSAGGVNLEKLPYVHQGGAIVYETEFENNIVWGNISPIDSQVKLTDLNGNEYTLPNYCCIQSWEGNGENNVVDDPLFVDVENGDFHIQIGSPCFNTGRLIEEITNDYEGEGRAISGIGLFDIGADELHSAYDSLSDPRNLIITVLSYNDPVGVYVEWDAPLPSGIPPGLDMKYNVYRSLRENYGYELLNSFPLENTEYTDEGMAPGMYYYAVTTVFNVQ